MEWPLVGVAVLFAVVYAWQVVGRPAGTALLIAQVVVFACWAVFLVDYLVRLRLAPDRWRWFRRNILSLLVVALPMLRPLRLIRLLTLFTVFQRAAGAALRGRVVLYAAGTTALLVFVASLAVLDVERTAPGADIRTWGQALWWASVTITTVGYGDYTPVTPEGRLIAIAMMVCGIALLGTVTATMASWLVERIASRDEADQSATRAQVAELLTEVRELRAVTARFAPASGGAGGAGATDAGGPER